MPRQAWKSRSAGGGTPTHFFFLIIFLRYLHYGVGVPSAYQTDLRGEKQKKKRPKKNKNRPKKGGGGRSRFSPPPWIRHCNVMWCMFLHWMVRCVWDTLQISLRDTLLSCFVSFFNLNNCVIWKRESKILEMLPYPQSKLHFYRWG